MSTALEPNERANKNNAASLVILSDQLSGAQLVVAVGIQPDRSWDKGDPIGGSGRAFQRYSGWEINLGPSEDTAEGLVATLLARVTNVSARILRASLDPRIRSVSVWLWSEDPDFGVDLPADIVSTIGGMGASLKVKVIDLDDWGGNPDLHRNN